MPNTYFQFKQFRIDQPVNGMKVTTDGCVFGALITELETGSILDIGTGTGLLALMIAQRTKAHIDAVEINPLVAQQASQNIDSSPWKDQIQVFNDDILQFSLNKTYDQIICNPPFFKNNFKGKSDTKNAAIHDDNLSMESLLDTVEKLLSKNGSFWVMYPAYEMEQFHSFAIDAGFFQKKKTLIFNKVDGPIFRVISEYTKNRDLSAVESDLVIKEDDGSYTQAFQNLLKPYYLHL